MKEGIGKAEIREGEGERKGFESREEGWRRPLAVM